MSTRQEMMGLLKTRREGFTLPRPFYNDPDFYKVDLETIFYREWLFAGHDCEVAEPGQYLTMQVGEYPLIIIRGKDGEIRALHNSCRHRGSRVCSAEHGSAKRLICPYHQWTYDTDGTLLRARHMDDQFDKAEFGLKQAHCQSVGGYIFVSVAQNPPELESFRAKALPYLAPHQLQDVKVAHENTIVENGNWKLVWENNRECYHCAANHPELCRSYPEAPTLTGVSGAMRDPEIQAHWAKCEAAGLPSEFFINPLGQFRLMRVPLVEGAVSYTMSGQPAVARPLCDAVSTPAIGSLLLFNYPSTWNHVLGDHAVTFRVSPIDATHTAVTTKWLVHKDAQEGVDYSLTDLTAVWNATNDQDRRIVEENQRGIGSPAYEPGPYAAADEGGVMQFVEWYCHAMERAIGGDRATLSRVA